MTIAPDHILPYVYGAYTAPNRHYHGIGHIMRMNRDLERYFHLVKSEQNYQNIVTAIYFHDVVYNPVPCSKSNEQLSANVYWDWCVKNGSAVHLNVVSAILATEHHFDDAEYSDITINLLLDLDLMAFQDDYEIFLKTQKEIDKEFLPFHAEEEVIDKRKKFLQDILENQTLRYRVIDPHGTLKGKAYRNIETYLNNGD